MRFVPYEYQRHAIGWILDHPACGLFLEMGLGKTVVTLTAIDALLCDRFEVTRVLVVAPLRVAATVWAEEAAKWDHLRHLRVVKVLGGRAERVAALAQDADVYVVNRENVPWLVLQYPPGAWPFDMVVLDELSSFKCVTAARFKAMRRVRGNVARIVGLTGTPTPNGLIDLWSQVYLLDMGERLGKTLGGYRTRYFNAGQRNARVVFNYVPKPEAPAAIYAKLGDLCVSMTAADYLSLPDRLDHVVDVALPPAARAAYDALEREMVLPLADGVITAQTAAVVAVKLLQMANGAVYDGDRAVHETHTAKLDALTDLIEAANGHAVLIYYAYQHDAVRIQARFPDARLLRDAQDVTDWNAGDAPLMLAHPDSAGHGLNLQQGGHIVIWFGLTWSLEKYQQANARLHRQGQTMPVTVYHLVARGTLDEDVMRVLAGKAARQDALIEAVRARVGAWMTKEVT